MIKRKPQPTLKSFAKMLSPSYVEKYQCRALLNYMTYSRKLEVPKP